MNLQPGIRDTIKMRTLESNNYARFPRRRMHIRQHKSSGIISLRAGKDFEGSQIYRARELVREILDFTNGVIWQLYYLKCCENMRFIISLN
jgi:hypothetical protein